MKKGLSLILLLGAITTTSAQQVMDLFVENGQPFRGNTHAIDENSKASGTPYVYEGFKPAKISAVEQTVMVRYNASNDNVEVANNKTYFILPKRPEYGQVNIGNGSYNLHLVDYLEDGKTINGFLFQLHAGEGFKLYKKEKIKLIAGRESSNTYERSSPPKFVKSKDTYFFQKDGAKITELPDDKKDVIALFPDKKDALNTFFKEQKISFKKEEDLMKLAQFLGTI